MRVEGTVTVGAMSGAPSVMVMPTNTWGVFQCFSVSVSVSVSVCVCARGRENECECVRERVSVCVRERVCGHDRHVVMPTNTWGVRFALWHLAVKVGRG